MAEDTAETADAPDSRDGRGAARAVKADLDERKVARGAAIGLPLVTIVVALGFALFVGAPLAILVLAAGMLLGVIGLFWASLRILSGDAALSPEMEALDATAHAVDALATRKKMLIRALKDLDNERALGKLDDVDYEQLSQTYRGELKDVLARIDATLEPHRPRAETAAHAYLVKAGLAEDLYRGEGPPPSAPASDAELPADSDASLDEVDDAPSEKPVKAARVKAPLALPRLECAKCSTSNEPDATFCKKCGASLAKETVDEA